MNQVGQFNRGGLSPYNKYYGKNGTQKTTINFGELAVRNCNTEYGFVCARELCLHAQRIRASKQLDEREIIVAMKKGK
jgi:hypothetical protein